MDISLCSSIRKIIVDKLTVDYSMMKMHNSLIGLFYDRTKIDKSISFGGKDEVRKIARYSNCEYLNDTRTIDFYQTTKQSDSIFETKRKIWIPRCVDVDKDNCFIPRGDA